jgi:hypothetical protein
MWEMLLGHCAGDYLFQNDILALNKGKNTFLGWIMCIAHCVIYTLSVCIFMSNYSLEWMGFVFLSHFIIDKFSLAESWSKMIKAKSLQQFLDDNKNQTITAMDSLIAGFTTFTYAVKDNTMHLILMTLFYKMMFT